MAVVDLPTGSAVKDRQQPNPEVIACVEKLMEKAKSGELQSILATGVTNEGCVWISLEGCTTSWVYTHRGALVDLMDEYKKRVPIN